MQKKDAAELEPASVEDALERLSSDAENGLEQQEVRRRLDTFGPNTIEEID